MVALLIYPTHANCLEAEAPYREQKISVASYPARVTALDHMTPANCWNPDADVAERMGFSVMQTVCLRCPVCQDCKQTGYLQQVQAAAEAQVALCTHQRASQTGLHKLSENRQYVSIHENPISLLRPRVEANLPELVLVKLVLDRMLNDPLFLNWFGDHECVDENGRRVSDPELVVRRERQLAFIRLLSRLVDQLLELAQAAQQTQAWTWGDTQKQPRGAEATLFFATRVVGVIFAGQPWRLVLGAASGKLHSAAIIVSQKFQPQGGRDRTFPNTKIVGFRDNPPHPETVTWFNDATLSVHPLQAVLRSSVRYRTPVGRLELRHKAVQIVRDVTRRTSPHSLQNILRGVLTDRQKFRHVGIVCHQNHVTAIRNLEPQYLRRIVRVAYFGSGDERSSNAWYQECDLIIVAGTPRLPQAEIATYLVQIGDVAAAGQIPTWNTIHWVGVNESREQVRVAAQGYLEESWRLAHRDLVRASLIQAVGRGRGILDQGCEVIVLSNEECGLVISDSRLEPINRSGVRILQALGNLARQNANNNILGKWRAKSPDIASATELSEGEVRKQLCRFERLGWVARVGDRSGWAPIIDLSLSLNDSVAGTDPPAPLLSGTAPGSNSEKSDRPESPPPSNLDS